MIRNHAITLLMDEYSHRFKNDWRVPALRRSLPASHLLASQPSGSPFYRITCVQHTERFKSSRKSHQTYR